MSRTRQHRPFPVICLILVVITSMLYSAVPSSASAAPSFSNPAIRAHDLFSPNPVNSTTDTGSCSAANMELRCAINQANTDCVNVEISCETIKFNIPTSGPSDPNCSGTPVVCTITPSSDLPTLTAKYVTIDGYSQPGATASSNADPRAQGDNAAIVIQLKSHCLTLSGSHETVQGLSLTNCTDGLLLSHASNATIQGNFLGLTPNGTTVANNTYGIVVTDGSSNNTVGGTLTGGATATSLGIGSANVVSGNNTTVGIYISDGTNGGASTLNVIKGNIVGPLADAVTPSSYIGTGIQVEEIGNGQVSATIGGSIPSGGANGDGNLVGGAQDGITVDQSHSIAPASAFATLLGNFVGVSPTGAAIGNAREGVSILGGAHAVLGQTNDNYAQGVNAIAFNGFSGIYAGYPNPAKTRVGIYRNAIYGNNQNNGFAEINLQNPGISGAPPITCTADAPPLANEGILCPVITAASTSSIVGTSCPGCTIDVYVATNGIQDLNHGGARRWLGEVAADANGNWTLSSFLSPIDPGQQAVTATATRLDSSGAPETSEFAANVSAPDHAFVVTKTGDSPKDTPCEDASGSYNPTLRCAISEGNVSTASSVSPGNSVTFSIPFQTDQGCKSETVTGASHFVCRTTLTSVLPPVSGNDLTIDGYSQSGASPNTNPHPLAQGDNSVVLIEVDSGNSLGDVLQLSGSHQTVQGLSLIQTRAGGSKINVLPAAQFASIEGNIIGLAADGSAPMPYISNGVTVEQGARDTTIGGTLSPGAGLAGVGAVNVISNDFDAVVFYPQTATVGANNVVKGNIIGANAAATSASNLGDERTGIVIINFTGVTIGGTTMTNDGVNADANLIAGWSNFPISASTSPNTTIQGNFIGVGPTGVALPNNAAINLVRGTTGTIGGATAAAGNTIANNTNGAIFIGDGTNFPDQVAIQHNTMFGNGGADGLILAGQQPSACTQGPPDAQVYPNEYLPCPTFSTTTTTKLEGRACSGCTVDVYVAPSATDKEGKTWIASVDVGACNGAGCTAPWSISSSAFATPLTAGQFVTATATSHGQTETSEFAPPVAVTQGQAPTLVVNTTQDAAAPCDPFVYSLRCAITDANSDGLGDTIHFNIPGCSGTPPVCVLTPASALPALSAGNTMIDGYSQPGAAANTTADPRALGDNAKILIQLKSHCLTLSGSHQTVRGLSLTGCDTELTLSHADHATIEGNFVGLYPDGTTVDGGRFGIVITDGSSNNVVGGTLTGGATASSLGVGSANVVPASTNYGVAVWDNTAGGSTTDSSIGNTIKGNLIGTLADAVTQGGYTGSGINVQDNGHGTVGATIGGPTLSGGINRDGNLIGGNQDGVTITQAAGTTSASLLGNYIGVSPTGTQVPNNTGVKVVGAAVVLGAPGDNSALSVNTIAYNTAQGVYAGSPNPAMSRVGVYRNAIFANGQNSTAQIPLPEIYLQTPLGDPGPFACTANYPSVANDGILCPVITSVSTSEIDGTSCANCVIDVYVATNGPNDFGHGGARRWLGEVSADANGHWALSSFQTPFDPGQQAVTATATQLNGQGAPETSEFAANVSASDHAFVVTKTGDSPKDTPCEDAAGSYDPTLRCAITQANVSTAASNSPGNSITFSIPQTDPGCQSETIAGASQFVCRITPTSVLPTVSGNDLTIDGFSQPGASPNTNLHPLSQGDNAVTLIEVDAAGIYGSLLALSGSHQTVQGLSLLRTGRSVGAKLEVLPTAQFDAVQGTLIGLNADGSVSKVVNTNGVAVDQGARDTTIGGTLRPGAGLSGVAAVNVISFNAIGVNLTSLSGIPTGGTNTTVKGNLIGTNVTVTPFPNLNQQGIGIEVGVFDGATIGGTTMTDDNVNADANLIAGQSAGGIVVVGSPNTTIQGNFIGVSPTGVALSNHYSGISMFNGSSGTIGGATAAARNTIANNNGADPSTPDSPTAAGVYIGQGTRFLDQVAIEHNSMYSNGGGGILLDGQLPSVCTEGPPDAQNYANQYTPCPTFTTTTTTQLAGQACSGCTVDLYVAPSATDKEGQTWIASVVASTCSGAGCTVPWSVNSSAFATPITAGQFVTATATTPTSPGPAETSEFVPPVAITQGQVGTLVVNTTQDPASCTSSVYSLRCAITDANTDGTGDTIQFNIAGCPGTSAVCVLSLVSKLPVITASNTAIDGYSQPGASHNTNPLLGASGTGDNAVILIQLDGGNVIERTGLDITGNNNTVRGLSFVNFTQSGIHLDGSTGNVVAGNFVGILPDGSTAGPNAIGVLEDNNATANTIGGTHPADENVISGNTGAGILAGNPGCTNRCTDVGNDVIEGNAVGTDAAGTHAVPNGTNDNIHAPGLYAAGTGDTITGNLVSSNAYTGIASFGNNSTIQGNYVGTDASGTAALGNSVTGTTVATYHIGLEAYGDNDLIGGVTAGVGNLVSGNGNGDSNWSVGLGAFGTSQTVQGNLIGTDITGTKSLPNNGLAGIEAAGGSSMVGGIAAGARNLVSGNTGYGIQEDGGNSTIEGNYIGTDLSGTKPLPNTKAGLYVIASEDIVGGTTAAARNIISGNGGAGLLATAPSTTIQGNYIGTDATGTKAVSNVGAGIDASFKGLLLAGEGGDVIGGTGGAGNLVSGNMGDGIDLHPQPNFAKSTIQGNKIGVDATGNAALGNGGNGVHVYPTGADGGKGTQVDAVSSNTVANNGASGVFIGQAAGETMTHVTISQNIIYGNTSFGIDLAPQGTVDCATAGQGPNDYIHCPVISSASPTAIKGTACPNCTVEVYLATADTGDQNHGQAQTLLGTATADPNGSWVLNAPFATTVTVGQPISATATSPASPGPPETSEFAANVSVHSIALPGVVTTTADLVSPCNDKVSLRCAIDSANAKGADFTVSFNIPSGDPGCSNGVCTISPTSALPTLNAQNTTIDGYSQPTASRNTLTTGDNAVIAIRLDGKNAPVGTDALAVFADHDVIQGLSITGFRSDNVGNGNGGNAIRFVEISVHSGQVLGNFIGLSPDGVTPATDFGGIDVTSGAAGVQIGSLSPGDRNLIAADFYAIRLRNSHSNLAQNNYIGVDASGNTGVPHIAGIIMTGEGSTSSPSSGDSIGGSQPAAGNVISANVSGGIIAAPSMPNSNAYTTIQNNIIGPNAAGTAGVTMAANNGPGFGINLSSAQFFTISNNIISGNKGDGLFLGGPGRGNTIDTNSIGVGAGGVSLPNGADGIDVAATESDKVINNSIANNKGWGIQVGQSPTETPHMLITRNSFASNTKGGILLPGQSVNSCFYPGSAGHPNDYTACPIIKSATTGQITGEACAGCRVEIFITPSATDDEGQTLLGLADAPACAAPCSGITTWSIKISNFQTAVTPGQYVTATATAPPGAFTAETSQFSWAAAVGKPLTVTTTADKPTPCAANSYSLRCAINQANTDSAGDSISFAIPTNAPGCSAGKGCSLAPTSPLPAITAPWTAILGYTQTGAQVNTRIPIGPTGGTTAVPAVQLLGSSAKSAPDGLAVNAAHVDIEGLAVQQFRAAGAGNGIHLSGAKAQYDVVSGNFLGLARDGSTPGPNNTGVLVDGGAANELIGLLTPADTNLISGNKSYGVELSAASKNVVMGNLIGTNAAGSAAVANSYSGVFLFGADGNTIGSAFTGTGNLISGNVADGIDGIAASNTTIVANRIGSDAVGKKAIPNGLSGIYFYTGGGNIIGGSTDALGNAIGGNGSDGIDLLGDAQDSVTHNVIGTGTATPATGFANGGTGVLVANTIDNLSLRQRPFLPPRSPSTGGHHLLVGIVSQNMIGGNGGVGVQIGESRTENDTHVLVSQNSIALNKGQGIRLAGMSASCLPSAGYGHGPNDSAVCPTISTQTTTDIEGSTCAFCTVEVFVASTLPGDNNRGQGIKYLGTALTDINTFQHWTLRLPAGTLTPGQTVTAVTIRPASSKIPAESSQFSANAKVSAGH